MVNRKTRSAAGMTLLLAAGAAGLATAAGQAHSPDEPVWCEIQATPANGMIALEGVVHADKQVSGSYRFRVSSAGRAGSSDISQGGNFTAVAGGATTLGKVMLGNTGAIYDATLEVTSSGVTIECVERIGGAI